MDYIVFGIGVGATLVLLGWVFREYGAAFKDRAARRDDAPVRTAEELVGQMAWRRFTRAIGTIVAGCGVVLILVTIGIAATTPSDSFASVVVGATFVVIMVGVGLWVGFFINRFGTHGILRPRVARAIPVEDQVHAPAAVARPVDPEVADSDVAPPVYGPAVPPPDRPATSESQPDAAGDSHDPLTVADDAFEPTPSTDEVIDPPSDDEGDGADALAAITASPSSTRSLDDLLGLPPDQGQPTGEAEAEADLGPELAADAPENEPDPMVDTSQPPSSSADDSATDEAPEPASREQALANLRRRRMQRQGSAIGDKTGRDE